MTCLEVQLLGFLCVRLDGRGVDLAWRKGLALIAYLADTSTPVGRDHMAGLMWPRT
jgi:DNA-binding SARP family transcriptional activator